MTNPIDQVASARHCLPIVLHGCNFDFLVIVLTQLCPNVFHVGSAGKLPL